MIEHVKQNLKGKFVWANYCTLNNHGYLGPNKFDYLAQMPVVGLGVHLAAAVTYSVAWSSIYGIRKFISLGEKIEKTKSNRKSRAHSCLQDASGP